MDCSNPHIVFQNPLVVPHLVMAAVNEFLQINVLVTQMFGVMCQDDVRPRVEFSLWQTPFIVNRFYWISSEELALPGRRVEVLTLFSFEFFSLPQTYLSRLITFSQYFPF